MRQQRCPPCARGRAPSPVGHFRLHNGLKEGRHQVYTARGACKATGVLPATGFSYATRSRWQEPPHNVRKRASPASVAPMVRWGIIVLNHSVGDRYDVWALQGWVRCTKRVLYSALPLPGLIPLVKKRRANFKGDPTALPTMCSWTRPRKSSEPGGAFMSPQ